MSNDWERLKCALLAEMIVAWEPAIAILTEHAALSARAFHMQPIAKLALAGNQDARAQVVEWARDLLELLEKVDHDTKALVDSGLSTAALARVLQDQYHLVPRKAVDMARQLKRHGSMLATWQADEG